tara:strand:- start:651 stop:989 length:339 start_codon:yes stop_codon:yes gene_type:complete
MGNGIHSSAISSISLAIKAMPGLGGMIDLPEYKVSSSSIIGVESDLKSPFGYITTGTTPLAALFRGESGLPSPKFPSPVKPDWGTSQTWGIRRYLKTALSFIEYVDAGPPNI